MKSEDGDLVLLVAVSYIMLRLITFHKSLLFQLNSSMHLFLRHLIGFFLFLALTIYTATKVPKVVDIHSLQQLQQVLRKADLHKIQSELVACFPSLPHLSNLHRLKEELKTSLPSMDKLTSLSNWHLLELISNCLPERFSHANQTNVCISVYFFLYLHLFMKFYFRMYEFALRPVFLYMGQDEFWIDKLISHYMVYVVSKSTKFGVCNC